MVKLKCSKCSEIVERMYFLKVVVCFNCKEKKAREYYHKHKNDRNKTKNSKIL